MALLQSVSINNIAPEQKGSLCPLPTVSFYTSNFSLFAHFDVFLLLAAATAPLHLLAANIYHDGPSPKNEYRPRAYVEPTESTPKGTSTKIYRSFTHKKIPVANGSITKYGRPGCTECNYSYG